MHHKTTIRSLFPPNSNNNPSGLVVDIHHRWRLHALAVTVYSLPVGVSASATELMASNCISCSDTPTLSISVYVLHLCPALLSCPFNMGNSLHFLLLWGWLKGFLTVKCLFFWTTCLRTKKSSIIDCYGNTTLISRHTIGNIFPTPSNLSCTFRPVKSLLREAKLGKPSYSPSVYEIT